MSGFAEWGATIGATLLIQGSLLLLFAFVSLRLLARRSARVRAGVIAATSIALVLLPLGSMLLPKWHVLPRFGSTEIRPDTVGSPSRRVESSERLEPEAPLAGPGSFSPRLEGPKGDSRGESASAVSANAATESDGDSTNPWSAFFLVYLLGVLWFAGRHLRATLALLRVVRRASQAPEKVQRHAREILDRVGCRRPVTVFVLEGDRHGPFTTGCWVPRIYLPATFGTIDSGQREAMLAHECAHVLHRDVLFLALGRLVSWFAWIQPLIHPLTRRASMERERAADDWVLGHTNTKATTYATWLVEHADRLRRPRTPELALAWQGPRTLESRVRAVLDPRTPRNESPWRRAIACFSAFALTFPLAVLAEARPEARPQDPEPELVDVTDEAYRSRAEFALAMDLVSVGQSAEEVRERLGEPEFIVTQKDGRGISTNGTKEIWCYGTDGDRTTPTLGQVYVDERDRVQYVFGKGEPKTEATFPEGRLRHLLRAIDGLTGYDAGHRFHPGDLIRATNLLLPLGKERALSVIAEYLRISSPFHSQGRSGVFLLLRTLFDPPEGKTWPRLRVGAPMIVIGGEESDWPRFPLALVDDVPLLVNQGYMLAGLAERPEEHMEWYVTHGVPRTAPLRPTDRPVSVIRAWLEGKTDEERASWNANFVGNQVARLLDTVHQPKVGRYGTLLPRGEEGGEKGWEEMARLSIHWDEGRQAYVFADGSLLPPREVKNYERTVWKPIADEPFEVSVVRTNEDDVELTVRYPKRLEDTFRVVLQGEVRETFQDVVKVGKVLEAPEAVRDSRRTVIDDSSVILSLTRRVAAGTRVRLVLRRSGSEVFLDPFVP